MISNKNFIWPTLKEIFSIFRIVFAPLYSRFSNSCISQILSYPNKPYINGKLIYSAFRWYINLNFEKCTLMTGYVVQDHICKKALHVHVNFAMFSFLFFTSLQSSPHWGNNIKYSFFKYIYIYIYISNTGTCVVDDDTDDASDDEAVYKNIL